MGFKRTNISESVANKSKASGARSSNVLLSIDLLTQDYNKSLKELIARLHNCPKPSRESAVQRTDIAKKVIMDISQQGIPEFISVNHVPPFLLSKKSPKYGDTIQVIASLKDPTSNDPYNHHKSQLSWIHGADPPQFQYTCDHANHISTNAMHNMPCSCLKVVFDQARQNHYWPLEDDDVVNEHFLTYLQPGCYFVKTCVSVAQSAIKVGKNTLHINIPSQKEIKDRRCMFVDKPCKPPPKYKAGVKTKGKRIRSRGEDGYPHRQSSPLSGPRNGKQIKGALNIPLSQANSAKVAEIHDRDGNDIILSNSAQAEIIALQKITKRTQPIDELIKGIPVEMEKSIVPGKSAIRRKQIDKGKSHYSPFRENENSPEKYNPEDIRQQDLEPLSSRNSIRPNDLIHRPNCSIRDNRNPLIDMRTLQKFFRFFGEADFPKITETFNEVLKSLIEERNEEFQEQYSGNEQSQEEETNTEENEQFEVNIDRNRSIASSQETNSSYNVLLAQDIVLSSTQDTNFLSTQDTEDTNMSDTGLGLTQECTTQESHNESMTNGIDNCTNNNREVQKTIKDEKLLPLLKRFKTAGKTAGEYENSPTPTAGETAGDYGNSPTPSNYSRAWLLHYGVRFNSGYNKEQLWKAAARTASNRDTVLKIFNDRNNSIVNGDRKDKMFERDRMDNMLVGNLKDKKWVTEFLKTHKKTFDRLGEHGQEEKKIHKKRLHKKRLDRLGEHGQEEKSDLCASIGDCFFNSMKLYNIRMKCALCGFSVHCHLCLADDKICFVCSKLSDQSTKLKTLELKNPPVQESQADQALQQENVSGQESIKEDNVISPRAIFPSDGITTPPKLNHTKTITITPGLNHTLQSSTRSPEVTEIPTRPNNQEQASNIRKRKITPTTGALQKKGKKAIITPGTLLKRKIIDKPINVPPNKKKATKNNQSGFAFDSFLLPLSDDDEQLYNAAFNDRSDLDEVGDYGGI